MMRRSVAITRALLGLAKAALVTLLAAQCLVGAPPRAMADAAFTAFIEALWPDAQALGISRATFDAAFKGVTPDLALPDLALPGKTETRGQAEFVRPPRDYLASAFIARLADQGRKLSLQHAQVLAEIERRIGVERHVVLAIWGRETAYGGHKSQHYAIRVLATQAYTGRRKEMFRIELLQALKMLDEKVITIEAMRSSWAGAMGLTQFMPSEYFALAYDLDGDGRRDIWGSVGDALASAANQLKGKGWLTGQPWGIEVRLALGGADCSYEGPDRTQPIAAWAKLGVLPVSGRAFSASELQLPAYLMMPAGAYGPAFLVTENFLVIKRYNMSDLYALFVGNLSDRIAGGGEFRTAFRDIAQLPTRDIEEVQRLLASAGVPMAKIDGKIGSNTRGEIGRFQRARQIKVDCWPTGELLAHLRARTK
ncbi:MAG TPA: lytic murein transglycosylase [Hyphomicrobiaceae bacterium]|nr:lytic murein transglycosylase [Hyphomicrobiaceae bacterium]